MRLSHIILLFVVVCALASCSHQKVEERGMYYWRTSLNLSKGERAFLQQHHVGRLYVRYFDVVCDDAGHSQPNATLSFDDSLPAGLEIVPTVYILNDCIAEVWGYRKARLIIWTGFIMNFFMQKSPFHLMGVSYA